MQYGSSYFWCGGGAKPIKDATATPADVATGKVFYNNEGRHVGEANDVFKNKTYAVKVNTSTIGSVNCITITAKSNGFSDSSYTYSRDYCAEIALDYKRINTVNVSGTTYKIYQDKRVLGDIAVGFLLNNGYGNYHMIAMSSNKIYLGNFSGKEVTFTINYS